MELKRVVVTGLGAITPLGKSVQEYWDGLVKGVSGADIIHQFDSRNLRHGLPVRLKILNPPFSRKKRSPKNRQVHSICLDCKRPGSEGCRNI